MSDDPRDAPTPKSRFRSELESKLERIRERDTDPAPDPPVLEDLEIPRDHSAPTFSGIEDVDGYPPTDRPPESAASNFQILHRLMLDITNRLTHLSDSILSPEGRLKTLIEESNSELKRWMLGELAPLEGRVSAVENVLGHVRSEVASLRIDLDDVRKHIGLRDGE